MKTLVGKFTFKVPGEKNDPEAHSDAGKKFEKSFEYQECNNIAEAEKVIADKKWNVVDMVNETLKANARASAYQSALLPYRPSTVSQEDIIERLVKDYVRVGISEDVARKTVLNMLAAKADMSNGPDAQ